MASIWERENPQDKTRFAKMARVLLGEKPAKIGPNSRPLPCFETFLRREESALMGMFFGDAKAVPKPTPS